MQPRPHRSARDQILGDEILERLELLEELLGETAVFGSARSSHGAAGGASRGSAIASRWTFSNDRDDGIRE